MSSNELTNSESLTGILSKFVVSDTDKPVEDQNGEYIIPFNGGQNGREMRVKLACGRKEGEAVVLDSGMPFMRVMFSNGVFTGRVEILNEYGMPRMKGYIMSDENKAFMIEYDIYCKEVRRGYYKDGKRYSEVVKNDTMEGYFNEVSVENGSILTISQYDASHQKKNGHCLEFENGEIAREVLYENGVRMEVIGEYREEFHYELEEGKVKQVFWRKPDQEVLFMEINESRMTEYSETGKINYIGEFKGDIDNGFVREGKGKEYDSEGLFVVYSGEWKDGKRDGLGSELKACRPVYYGQWKDGTRNGCGTEMDENGNVVKSGLWSNAYCFKVLSSSLEVSPMRMEELKIGNKEYNNSSLTELTLFNLDRLKRIVIGDECFGSVRLVELDGLSELESVVIGEKSFRISGSERTDGVCRIVNCAKLKSIQIGEWSFSDYHSFELNNLQSLQSIDTGNGCFNYAPAFSLTGLID